MESDEELDIMLLVVIALKMKMYKERIICVQDIYKTCEYFRIQRLVRKMKLTNREAHYK